MTGSLFDLPDPHDALFRFTLSRRNAVLALIRRLLGPRLPRPVLAVTPEPARFLAPDGRQSEGDLLFRVHLDGGAACRLRVLVDHRSGDARGALVQIAGYLVRAVEHDLAAGGPLLPTYTIVVFNGRRRWNGGMRLGEFYQEPIPELALDFGIILLDLTGEAAPDPAGWQDDWLETGLALLRAARLAGLGHDHMTALLRAAARLDPVFLRLAFAYLATVRPPEQFPMLERAMNETVDFLSRMNLDAIDFATVDSGLQVIWRRGHDEGREEGREEGRRRHAEETLLRVLTRRFAPLPRTAVERVSRADVETLDRWLDRTLEAGTLDDVLQEQDSPLS